ncbi:MAG TPA: 4-hydroxythreonine-4-phosphate dehydrogenase PdxA [Casimicrobiaceae bacterium]|nr:4-hydroxythreonine-4-phosphate dehydrogenase PdxA [Casimicrobiaceae bacterium]
MPPDPTIAITSGEPAGIGPELCAMLAQRHRDHPFAARIVVLGDCDLLRERAHRIGIAAEYADYDPVNRPPAAGTIEVWHAAVTAPVSAGHPDPVNARFVLDMLARGCDACATGAFDALVTAPVQKSVLLDAGIAFIGHTEFFAQRTHTPRVVMMLVGGATDEPLRVALVTTHLALSEVPRNITREAVEQTLRIVHDDLVHRFGIAAPRIAVCGLNPHAGEGGHFGREEIDTIAPALQAVRDAGVDAHGPLPADTVFVPDIARGYDAIVAMYHDQGLPVLKAASFGHGVNVTLGLPFVRTSVDHGTALDLACDAAKARTADVGSLIAAVDVAIAMSRRRASVE